MPVPGDNVSVTRSSDPSAEIIAADELTGGVKVQRVKIGFGVDGSYGDVTPSNPLPVAVAGGIGTQDVRIVGQTATVDVSVLGTATITGIVSVNNFPAVQTVDGTVDLDPSASVSINGAVSLDPSTTIGVNVLNDLQLDPSSYHGVVGVDFDPSDTVNTNVVSPLESTPTGDRVAVSVDPRLRDVFSRLRTAEMRPIFDSKLVGGDDTSLWSEVVFSGGGSSHVAADSEVSLTTAASGDAVIRQTYMRHFYEPGKSSLNYMTGLMTSESNVRKRMGLYSTSNAANSVPQNGVYFEVNPSNPAPVSFNIAKNGATAQSAGQSVWNLDPLDGTGPSGQTLDLTKSLLMFIEFAWLGAGPVTVGFVIGGDHIPAHTFTNVSLSSAWTTTPNLPFGYAIYQFGAGSGSMRQGCVMAGQEGQADPLGKNRTVNNGAVPVGLNVVGTKYAMVGIRLKSAFTSAFVTVEGVSGTILTKDDLMLLELIRNPTVAGTFTYSDLTNSVCQTAIGVTANTVTGGTVLWSGYVSVVDHINALTDASLPRLGAAIDGTRDTLVLVATPLTAVIDAYGAINWREAQ